MKFGLSSSDISEIKKVFSKFKIIKQVKVYGSRAIGNFKPGSDIDLALFGSLGQDVIFSIKSELEQLPVPYKFDVLAYSDITNLDLKKHIDSFGKEFK